MRRQGRTAPSGDTSMTYLFRLLSFGAVAVGAVLLPFLLSTTARPVSACSPPFNFDPVGDSDLIVGGWLQGWQPSPNAGAGPADNLLPIRLQMSVERVYKGAAPADVTIGVTLYRTPTMPGTTGEYLWPGGALCSPFGRDPSGSYAILGLRRNENGTYAASTFSSFFRGNAPHGADYEAGLARLLSQRGEATLNLVDPRPCIPDPGQRRCDPARAALWEGDAAAWAARGVTDGAARLREILTLRVAAGDPGTIASIARRLGTPYLQVTRLRYIDQPLLYGLGCDAFDAPRPECAGSEFVEITNLGGGAQDLTSWRVQSPLREMVVRLPDGLVLEPGQSCRVYTGVTKWNSCAGAAFPMMDVWPDAGGRAVLSYEALALTAADTSYSADPAAQPPPPNLEGVRATN